MPDPYTALPQDDLNAALKYIADSPEVDVAGITPYSELNIVQGDGSQTWYITDFMFRRSGGHHAPLYENCTLLAFADVDGTHAQCLVFRAGHLIHKFEVFE
jgi:hypothetical protein